MAADQNLNIFSTPAEVTNVQSSSVTDLLGDFTDFPEKSAAPSTCVPSSTVLTPFNIADEEPKKTKPERPTPPRRPSPPIRPPPPRPLPRQETKDLILSVTGALEATSSDLLERLQATRTPSPTPLRDLHSPSPTLEINDLLGDDIMMPQISHGERTTKNDIQQEAYNIFDAIASLSKEEEDKTKPPVSDISPMDVKLKPSPPPIIPIRTTPPLMQPTEPKLKQSPPSTILQNSPKPELPHQIKSNVSLPHGPPPAPPSRPPPPQLPVRLKTDFTGLSGETKSIATSDVIDWDGSSQKGTPQLSRKSSLVSTTSSRRSSIEQPKDIFDLPTSVPAIVAEPVIKTPDVVEEVSENIAPLKMFQDPYKLSDNKPTGYIATRKASHDVTAERSQVIPTYKKYSLDYSASSLAERNKIKTQLEQYTTSSSYTDNSILEAPKFPVMSTTPILSFENIDNENLYAEKEDGLIFDEAPVKQDPFNEGTATSVTESGVSNFFTTEQSQAKDVFDVFEQKFESVKEEKPTKIADPFDPFGTATVDNVQQEDFSSQGFGNEGGFDEFLALNRPLPTFDAKFEDNTADVSNYTGSWTGDPGVLNFQDATAGIGSYDKSSDVSPAPVFSEDFPISSKVSKTDSTETPPTPLFDEDVSQPLEPFPRTNYDGPGWEMQIRYPIRKKFTGQRFWKKVFVRLVYQGETPHLELVNKDDGKETLHHEWPLQPCYAISDIGAQQYDQYGKIFTVKIQFVVYKERPGVRPGQVTKAERLTNKLSQFAAYAIQGDYQGVKEFGSDLKKLGLPVEHSPQISLICKLGSHNYEDIKQFSACVEEALFRLPAHRDNIHITYKMEEVQITAVDELYVEQNSNGSVLKQIARVRIFFLGFLTGMPDVEIGVNDLWRQGKEVVGRHDIIPVVTEEWIRLENMEFHTCVQQDYEETRTIRLKPPDACYLELMRFRVRPPKNRELPLQLKTVFRTCGNKVDILADILVPGFTSRKLGQIPCEDVAVRIPIPECWIYLFRVEKHFRYGSVKSAHRRTGKVKGIERFLGTVDTLEPHLIEVTSGHAKYEHHHKAIVWRMSRLPKEGQGAYTTHNLVCHLALTSYDQIPEELAKHCYVEFTMPVTQVSHTTVRSVSISNSDSDSPPEKYVRHLARHEYKVEIEHTQAEGTSDYIAATMVKPPTANTEYRPPSRSSEPADSNSDSD